MSKADKHKKSGDEYVRSGGSKATRDAVDRVAAQEAQHRQQVEAARRELGRDR
jgi:hypothetical protein